MVERISALSGAYETGRFEVDGKIGVTLCEIPDLSLHQIASWPDTLAETADIAAKAIDATSAPGPGRAVQGGKGALLRVEPLKFWLVGEGVPEISTDQGATLDLSHSRTRVRISGPEAATLINRHLPIDLRETAFPVGAVGSSAFDHVGVTLWRTEVGYELFLPRGFALSLWDVLLLGAAQFGYQVSVE